MAKILFGPSGNSNSFYEQGHKTSMETAKWLKEQGSDKFEGGLDLFEYSFGQGFRMSSELAKSLGDEFKKFGLDISLHAPYFINFANPDPVMYDKSLGYIKTGIHFLHSFGGKRLVFHAGSCGKETRENAVSLIAERFKEFMPEIEKELGKDMFLCPETMGKTMQIGTYKEIVDLCAISPKLLPAFDFGHINALTHGGLKTKEDYQKIFDYSFEKLGDFRTKNAHIHFSKIEYAGKGEIRHLTFADSAYGPEFEPLCDCLVENNLNCHVICESDGTMAEDSVMMKDIYLSKLRQKFK